jgi:glycosyltransferase involved in cell wall biosynthesis
VRKIDKLAMKTICIGIPVHSEPRRLQTTLASLYTHTHRTFNLLLLPDGPDVAMKSELARLSHLPQASTDEAKGDAACFNRLIERSKADVVVLLESGAQAGPGWLEHLLAALDADERNGLAGPSTNRAWNEQAAFPRSGDSSGEIIRTAREAACMFGSDWKTLEPLYSLADFCYAVRSEVIAAVGFADETYGLGPCWEMDYNIRAARAGFRGVWACGAFVHRAAFTARRKREEALRFEASKRRYQDKFCALRLRAERHDYEPHCKGDACEHFAPASLIEIHLPRPGEPPGKSLASPDPGALAVTAAASLPQISCIMPTCDRPDFVLQSIRYFQRQDYPSRELIIIDDGKVDLSARIPCDPSIRYIRLSTPMSIGMKRNKGCELANGQFIAHWDDDDWYDARRLSVQMSPLLAGIADVSGLFAGTFFDLHRWEFWECAPELHKRLFVEDVHGGTLVFRRSLFNNPGRYPDRSLAEDALFLRQCVRAGARLVRVPNEGLFIYVRHGANSWSFACGQYLTRSGWQRIPEPGLPAGDRSFYENQSTRMSRAVESRGTAAPLVSCIMPTADRRAFIPTAIRYFLRQDYSNSELIIVDDGKESVEDLVPSSPRIRYHRLNSRRTIGAKRNLACEDARGEVVVHWDDDDWMAAWRLRYQVGALLENGADVCGLNRIIYLDVNSKKSWEYAYGSKKPWVAGNTFCYSREFWRRKTFPDIQIGEDVQFLWNGRPQIVALQDPTFYVALIHPRNVSPKKPCSPWWQPYPILEAAKILGDDWSFYESLNLTF